MVSSAPPFVLRVSEDDRRVFQQNQELMDDARAITQATLSYFGMTAMFPHFHPLVRAGEHYYNEALACLGIAATLSVIGNDLVRHQLRSQEAEELMHFMKGKYQIDAYAPASEDQMPIECELSAA